MFTHLHVHSHFSLLESSIRIEELVAAASALGMKAIALTDKYVLSGAVEFYKQAKAAGIKPITGCEICLLEKNTLSHLVLLVKNKKGYENLCQLVSKSHTDAGSSDSSRDSCSGSDSSRDNYGSSGSVSFNGHIPSVRMEDIKNFSTGLVCLSGCNRGLLSTLLKAKKSQEAAEFACRLYDIFGQDFYIEIQRYRATQYSSQINIASAMLESLSQKLKIGQVATNNVHYLTKNDYDKYRYLAKIRLMGTKNDPTSAVIANDEHYLKPEREMTRMFSDIFAAVNNTRIIAEKCSFDFELGKILLPRFEVPPGSSQEQYLKKLCDEGIRFRFGESPGRDITERLARELAVIERTGFTGYFLVVADIARFACESKIPICGKGSAAGSLVSYVLRISNVDPVENNLYFERFLNDERKEPPDIDIDVSNKDRLKIWHYLRHKYGGKNIARVSSFATTKPRASIRESGRILSVAKDEIDQIIKSVPGYNRFFTDEKMDHGIKSSNLVDIEDPGYKSILSLSRNISGYIRHVSMHPSAFIVSNSDLSKKIPLTLSETGELMSQYDMNSIDDLGILKIDLINSLSLSLIADVAAAIKRTRNIGIDISKTSYKDSKVFELMQKGKTLGVFQLESFGIRTLSRKIKPACLNDITLLVSLYRPGPQQSGMVNNFIERKFGREKTTYIHKDLEPLLKETYGVILYQEQAMQVAIRIAGYSLREADSLRKAMVNLSREKMLAQQERFLKGGLERGYDSATVNEVYRLISRFASYGFVKAHAAAYAELSYKTCYLKAHFPAEFLSTILTNNSGYYSKMQYMEEARRLGIGPRLPDINKNGFDFTVEDNGSSIRVPLVSVRDLGHAGVDSIIKERAKNGIFKSFFDFYRRTSANCKVTKSAIENLIKIGAFDGMQTPRKDLLLTFYWLKSLKKKSLNALGHSGTYTYSTCTYSSLAQSSPASPVNCLDDFGPEEKLELEAQILGFYVSDHPLKFLKKSLEKKPGALPGVSYKPEALQSIDYITESRSFYNFFSSLTAEKHYRSSRIAGSTGRTSSIQGHLCPYYILTAGIIITKRMEKTKDSKNMMFCTMEDEGGMYEAVFFPEPYKKNAKIIMNSSFVILRGRLHLKDNNVSLIVRDVYSISALKKVEDIRKEEKIKTELLTTII